MHLLQTVLPLALICLLLFSLAHENPPDYNVSGVPESDVSPLDDECDLPPLDYDTVMSLPAGTVPTVNSDETEQPKGSIIGTTL